jgi:hypothetical protein
MTIKHRVEQLEDVLTARVEAESPTWGVLLYDPKSPPDVDAIVRESGLSVVLVLPDNGRGGLPTGVILCGANPQA